MNKTDLKTTLKNATPVGRTVIVEQIAQKLVLEAFGASTYDLANIIIEPVSYNDNDWYLYIVACKKANADTYSVWTLNLTASSLYHGHYDIKPNELTDTIILKKT